MSLFATMDALLRDPDSVYRRAAEGQDLGRLCALLLAIFVLTSALYGAAMGCFRWIHPEYVFSDFELVSPDEGTFEGKVAGVGYDDATVYTETADLPAFENAVIRFNLTRPTDPYAVTAVGEEKGYGAIQLAPGSPLEESGGWRTLLLVAAKTPAMFLITLAVCAMALYVFNLALDIRLHFMPVMTAMSFGLAATGVMLGVFVPISGLFSLVTEDYHFMKVMHLFAFVVAGSYGVKTLYRGLVRLAPEGTKRLPTLVFLILTMYCAVGGQVAWTLKPWLGTPYLPATPPFRVESGNIYVSFFSSLAHVAQGKGRTLSRELGLPVEDDLRGAPADPRRAVPLEGSDEPAPAVMPAEPQAPDEGDAPLTNP